MRTKRQQSRGCANTPFPCKFLVRSFTKNAAQTTTNIQTSLGRVTLGLLLALLLIPSIFAFGIKPAQKTIAFEPNLTIDAQFDLVRDTEEPGIANALVEDELAQYISLPQSPIPLSGGAQSIRYTVKLPESLTPGTHVGKIIISEQSSASGVINSRLRITFKVYVTVPGEEIPLIAEVVNPQNALYIEPSVTLNTQPKIQLNELNFLSLGLFALIGTLIIYAALVLRTK